MDKQDYEKLHGFYFEDIEVGQEALISKTVTESDIISFANITGDNNPVHVSKTFAERTIFKRVVAHGFLSASLISMVIGMKLPGPGSIYINQSLSFLAPVFPGDTIEVKVRVKSKDNKKKRVYLETFCEKKGKKVLDGEAEILVESKKK